ncbi:MAG: hypothetical protein LBV62_03550 [Rickettsiales bacterium]|jgi:hypothetical protein|nr:hypothetical protein [Rickettsiales bacterium]
MIPGTTENPLGIKVTHDVSKINDAIGFFPKAWRATKKYSVNNTLPIAAANAWLQFSLAYVVAIMITSNDLSFITNIFNPQAMSAYALVSVILGIVLLTSLTLKYMSKQEIKEEKLINDKIRGDKDNEISKIAENALKIEITPDLSLIGHKKENFSIVLLIAEEQSKILESQKEENRNKIIFLTIPCAINAAIIVGALIQNRFSFSNVQGWEWDFIAFVSAVSIAGICITLSKSRNNEINNNHNIVKKFNNLDILLPWRKGSIVSVMEKKTKGEGENDPISRLIKLLDTHLTNFTDKIVDSFDKHLDEAKNSLDEKLLEPANASIKETLDHLKGIKKDIKKDLDELHKEITIVLNEAKQLAEKANLLDIESAFSKLQDAIEVAKDKIEQFQPSRLIGYFQSNTQPDDNDNELLNRQKKFEENAEKEKTELKEQLKKVTNELKELKNKQTQPNSDYGTSHSSETSSTISTDSQQDEEKVLDQELAELEREKRIGEKREKRDKLKKKLSEQKETDEWKEKINGKTSEFFNYVLESTKLKIKDDQEKEVKIKNDKGKEVDPTLRNFDNKIIIHWKDGSQTTCPIKRQIGPQTLQPSTKVDFVDQNIQAAWEIAQGKSL